MQIRDITDGVVSATPLTPSALGERHPNVSFPAVPTAADLESFGCVVVALSIPPAHDPRTHVVVEMLPALVDGAWTQQWAVQPLSEGQVTDNLTAAKDTKSRSVNLERDNRETQGFPHAGLWFQSDERSVARLNSTALTASSALLAGQSPAFPDWLAADNTPLPVDAHGVLALQASLTAHAGALHFAARTIKAQITATTSLAELDAIDLQAGWPL